MTSSRDSARIVGLHLSSSIFSDAVISIALEDITTLWEFTSKREKMEVEMRGDNLSQMLNIWG
jgi:hypothetical protein